MARQPVKPKKVVSIRERNFRRPKIDRTPRRQQRPGQRKPLPVWLAPLLVVLALALLGGGAWLLWRPGGALTSPTPTVTALLSTGMTPESMPVTPTASATLAPTATATATVTPTPTPVPQICEVIAADAWARAQPAEQSTGVALLRNGEEVGVIAEVQSATGDLWYQVVGYRIEAYIPAAAVLCPAP